MLTEDELLAQGWIALKVVRYSAALGPTFKRLGPGGLEVALLAQEHLGNDSYGIVHGGAIMTFADMALGAGVGHAVGFGHFVTAQMQVHFVGAGQTGRLITCRPDVVKAGGSMVFVRGIIESEGQPIASADGIFKRLSPERAGRLKSG
jgi:acyl-coenzyme A thioesterase PaaI-like protein